MSINTIEAFSTNNKCYQAAIPLYPQGIMPPSYADYNYIGYIMFSAQGTGDGVVVTKNEEIL